MQSSALAEAFVGVFKTGGDILSFPYFVFCSSVASWPCSFEQAKHVVKFVVWWVGLGTVSSVGLGCGFQTGVLFLFPHIMKVKSALDT